MFPTPGGEISRNDYANLVNQLYERHGAQSVESIVGDLSLQLLSMSNGKSNANQLAFFPILIYAGHAVMGESVRKSLEARMNAIMREESREVANALGIALLTMSKEEWKAARINLLRVMIPELEERISDRDFFARLKPVIFAWSAVDKMHMESLYEDAGIEPEMDGDVVIVAAHHEPEWIRGFMAKVDACAKEVSDQWKELYDALHEGLQRMVDLETLIGKSRLNEAFEDDPMSPAEWLDSFR